MDLTHKLIYKSLLNKKYVSEENFKNFLKEASDKYYTGDSFITDSEFDSFRELFKEKFNYDAVSVGSKVPLKGFVKAKHRQPMGSLTEFSTKNDVKSEIGKWFNKYIEKDELCTTEKLDGLSVSVEYINGVLTQALTRGDGFEGDDITENVRKIERVLKKLDTPFTGLLRGEIVLRKSVREKHFPHYANERNGAVGLIKRLDGVGCEHLDIYFFKIHSEDLSFDTEFESLEYIKNKLKLNTPRFYKTNLKTLILLHKRYEEEAREKLDYLLDGLVVNINCKNNQFKVTQNELLPEYSRKFKFASEEAVTEIVGVVNQVGRTGAITPLAILDPVSCGGTTISKATLHNYVEVKRLGIKVGDLVKVVRSKDVIPKIVGVAYEGEFSEDIKEPERCPICSTKVRKEDTLIFCPNDYCAAKVSRGLIHWLNILNIKNMGERIVESLIETKVLKTIPDFYKLTIEDIASLEGQGVKNAKRILNEIHSKKEIRISELLAGLNIRNLSVKRAEVLEDVFKDLDTILDLKTSDLVALEGFESKLANYIVSGLLGKRPLIQEILKYITLKEKPKGILSGKTFCFSGFRDENLTSEIKQKGGTVSESFSKKVSYLVVKSKNTTTSKTQKASKYGIPVIDLDDLEGMVRNTLF